MDLALIGVLVLTPLFTLALILLWRFFLKEDAAAEQAGLPQEKTPEAPASGNNPSPGA